MSGSLSRRLVAGPAAIVLIVATIALARLITVTTPDASDNARPWVHHGQLNEAVVERTFEVTVLSVRGGRAYEGEYESRTTEGVFLLVRARVMALEAETEVRRAALIDESGNSYDAALLEGLSVYPLLPRIAMEGELVFEVPPAVATHLVLRLSSTTSDLPQHQTVVEVPLPIGADDVQVWADETDPLTVMAPEVVG